MVGQLATRQVDSIMIQNEDQQIEDDIVNNYFEGENNQANRVNVIEEETKQ